MLEAKWCGRLISAAGIAHDPARLSVLAEMATPTTAADLQQFLCAMNWLRTSLPNYATVVAPLHDILEVALKRTSTRTRKAAKSILLSTCEWTAEHDRCYSACKEMLMNAVRLAHPDPQQVLCLFTDASEHSWGAILTQVPEKDLCLPVDQQRHTPLNFLSGRFTKTQLNWSIIEKEGFALVESCMRLEYLLLNEKGFKIFLIIETFCSRLTQLIVRRRTLRSIPRQNLRDGR
jgi:hypothetical protein